MGRCEAPAHTPEAILPHDSLPDSMIRPDGIEGKLEMSQIRCYVFLIVYRVLGCQLGTARVSWIAMDVREN